MRNRGPEEGLLGCSNQGLWPQEISYGENLKSERKENESNFGDVKLELPMGHIGNRFQKVVGHMKPEERDLFQRCISTNNKRSHS